MSDTDRLQTEFWPVDMDANFPLKTNVQNTKNSYSGNCRMHFHNCIEIVYACANTCCSIFESEKICMHEGDVLTISSHVPHSFGSSSNQSDENSPQACNILFVDYDLLMHYFESFPADWSIPNIHVMDNRYQLFEKDNCSNIGDLLSGIHKELSLKRNGWQICSILKTLLLFAAMEHTFSIKQTIHTMREGTMEIRPALNYIKSNYAEHIYMSMLSDLCHMSQASFHRKFKKIMGTSPLDYIHSIRIQHACAMLRGTNMSILEISMQVGFDSISSFNRQFMIIKGITPNQYRAVPPESQLSSPPFD